MEYYKLNSEINKFYIDTFYRETIMLVYSKGGYYESCSKYHIIYFK